MGTPMLRGLPPTDGDQQDDGSLGAAEPRTTESRNVVAPVAIVLIAIVAVSAGFLYVTPNSALSALTEEPEQPPARTTVFDGLDRLRELGVITDDESSSSDQVRPTLHTQSSRTNDSDSHPRVRFSTPQRTRRSPELTERMTRLQDQLAEAKRRMNSMGDARDSSRSRQANVNEARVSTSTTFRPASRAQDETVKRSYGPFTRPGLYAFESDERHATPRPVSYGSLRRAGIATDYNKFLQAMTGSGLYRKNDRPPFYPIPTTDQDRNQMEELFEEFNELAPVWVQMGILRP